VADLYAFFMRAVAPVRQANRPTGMRWPLSIRWPLAIWNAVFLDTAPYKSTPGEDAQWNRGAYLVQGLGHCGACHTPRGWVFEEEALTQAERAYLSGAPLDNWSAVNLRGDEASGLGRWSEAELTEYLKTGHNAGGTAFGSMIDAINYSTQYLSDDDNAAIAHYLKSLSPAHPETQSNWSYNAATETALNASQFNAPGSLEFVQYCAGCHRRDGKGAAPYIPPLAGNPAVLDPDAVSLINITLNGSSPVVIHGTPDAYRMIPFRASLNDERVAELLTFVRTSWGNDAAPVKAGQVAAIRANTDPVRYEELDLLRMR
jgi:mono/diheme cytochrome c family protein